MLKKIFYSFFVFIFLGILATAFAVTGKPLQNYIYNDAVDVQEKPVEPKVVKPENNFVMVSNKIKRKVNTAVKKVKKKEKATLKNLKNNAPKSVDEYNSMAQDVKRSDVKVPEPKFEKDEKIVPLPDPHVRIVKYNDPPGGRELNLSEITKSRRCHSIGVLSPDESMMVYSDAYYYIQQNQVASELFVIYTNPNLSTIDKLKNSNEIQREIKSIMQTGTNALENYALKTLTVVDWSADSKKIAFKEKIGSTFDGVWQTNLYVYNFETGKLKRLNEVREAIKYWWKSNKNLDLVDFMWDIVPMGWDANFPDRIIVYAYAYTGASPKFLGAWSIDSQGNRSELLSLDDSNFQISANGYMLKAVIRE